MEGNGREIGGNICNDVANGSHIPNHHGCIIRLVLYEFSPSHSPRMNNDSSLSVSM